MSKINVMYLRSSYAQEGGPETLILSVLQGIDTSKFNINVVVLQELKASENFFESNIKSLGFNADRIVWRNFIFFLPSFFKLISLIKKHNVNIIHTHDVRSDFMGLIAGKMLGIPVVTSVHGWIGRSLKERIHDFFDKLIVRFASTIIANSKAMQRYLVRLKIQERKVRTIHNAVDLSNFMSAEGSESTKMELGLNSGFPIIGTVGRLDVEKGHEILLEAAQEVIQSCPEAAFVIAGQGPIESDLKKTAEKLKLSQRVTFTGYFRNLSKILGIMDIFVLPSLSEGLPLTLLEAMAAGKPIVATDVGGVPELIINGQTGLLVKSRSARELSKAILELVQNKEKARGLGEKAREAVLNNFSSEVMIKKLEDVYESVCSFTSG